MDPTTNPDVFLRLARVVKLHRSSNTVDLLFTDNGAPVPAVTVLGGVLSSRAGAIGHAEPSAPDAPDALARVPEDELLAVCGFLRGAPLVLGFIPPANCQYLFDRPNFSVDRHRSDVYRTIDEHGNTEFSHPSGTYLRIASGTAHEDLTGADHNGLWAIDNNTDTAPHVHLEVANAGAVHTTVDIDPAGNVSVTAPGTLTADCPHTHVTGSMVVDGALLSNTSVADPLGTMQEMRDTYNSHTHPGDSGGTTSDPNQPMT